jgi:D-lactate dehydrogenase
MRDEILSDSELQAKIRRKYAIKNTVGYSLNAFIDFADPVDILAHLMIGSEGTLGFISSITYRTVPDHSYKKAALFFFDSIKKAAEAAYFIKDLPVSAIELLDGIALGFAQGHLKSYYPANFNSEMAALLIDVRAESEAELTHQIEEVEHSIQALNGLVLFTGFVADKSYRELWSVREGTFTIVATNREPGTLVLIEDIAVPVESLPNLVDDLRQLFDALGFPQTSIFGHARDGNLHFVMALRLEEADELRRYEILMQKLADLIINQYQGSLKAEHGTGRNMAPFVEMEWGKVANDLMWRLKQLLDPQGILNPDVILSKDPAIHLKNLKSIPILGSAVDRCIECGFCEKVCPSRDLTLTPRQRIVALRSMELIRRSSISKFHSLKNAFSYKGSQTCAATGMCAEVCPVGINTGQAIKEWRAQYKSFAKKVLWNLIARYQDLALKIMHMALKLGGKLKAQQTDLKFEATKTKAISNKIVLFPSCGCRLLDSKQDSQLALVKAIIKRLGFEIIMPDFTNQCCGLMFASEGMTELAKDKHDKLLNVLDKASEFGKWPVITENSSCALELGSVKIIDIWQFLLQHLNDWPLKQTQGSIMLHVNCSQARLKEKEAIIALAKRCAKEVVVPADIYCCGFAGSKGFTTPELNKNALKTLAAQIPSNCQQGYTCLQSCEIGLSKYSGISYESLLKLILQSMN